MVGVGDPLHGLLPALALDNQRLDLSREEGSIVNRQQVDALGKVFAGRHHGAVVALLLLSFGAVAENFRYVEIVSLIIFVHRSPSYPLGH